MGPNPVLTTKSEAVAKTVRAAIMSEFSRLWVCVTCRKDGSRTIDVTDNWGGPLQKELDQQVREFVSSFATTEATDS